MAMMSRDEGNVARLRPLDLERPESIVTDEAGPGLDLLLEQFVRADTKGLQRLTRMPRMAVPLRRAVHMIAASRTVFLVADRRSFAVACYLACMLGEMGVRSVLVDGIGGMFVQQLSQAARRDVLVVVSSKALSKDVMIWVRRSSARGIATIALTDGRKGPLAELADVVLATPRPSVKTYRSLAVPMTLATVLAFEVSRLRRPRAAKPGPK